MRQENQCWNSFIFSALYDKFCLKKNYNYEACKLTEVEIKPPSQPFPNKLQPGLVSRIDSPDSCALKFGSWLFALRGVLYFPWSKSVAADSFFLEFDSELRIPRVFSWTLYSRSAPYIFLESDLAGIDFVHCSLGSRDRISSSIRVGATQFARVIHY